MLPAVTSPSAYPREYGTYVLLEPLGEGGMSEVELARKHERDARYVRFVVIKRIHKRHTAEAGFVRMFQDEARINAELQHENIAQVYDFGQVDGQWYIAMEYVAGLDLRGAVQRAQDRGERLPTRLSLRIVSDVLKALQYAHGRVDTYGKPMNIVHRDVNPRNVMLSVRGEVKLIDFGVAKADTRSEHTQGEVIKGKFAYMAPEQIESGVPVDGRADLFAVGLMLYELLAGEHPFAGLREIQIVHRVLAGRIPVLPDIPGDADPVALRAVVRKALAMNPSERYPDAETFRRALELAGAAGGGLATSPELGTFVRQLDPGRAEGMSQRLEAWRDMDMDHLSGATPSPPLPVHARVSKPRPAVPQADARQDDFASEATLPPPVAPMPPAPPAPPLVPTSQDTLASPRPPSRLPWVLAGGGIAAASLALVGGLALAWLVPIDGGDPAPVVAPVDPPTEAPPARAPRTETQVEEPARRKAPAPTRPPAPAKARPAPGASTSAAPVPEPAPETAPANGARPATAPTQRAEPEPEPAAAALPGTPSAPELPASPETAAATETAVLFVGSGAKGRQVYVDGVLHGTSPVKTRVPVGTHEVRVTDTGTNQSWTQTVKVEKTGRNYFNIGD